MCAGLFSDKISCKIGVSRSDVIVEKIMIEQERKNRCIMALIILLVFTSSYLFIKDTKPLVDEIPHHEQIEKFVNKDYSINPDLTTIPG